MKGCNPQSAPSPLIRLAHSQNGALTFLEENTLQRILKIEWLSIGLIPFPRPPLTNDRLVSGGFFPH